MTPVELIALAGCSRPEGGRGCDVCVAAAQWHMDALLPAGLAAVPTDLLRDVEKVLADLGACDNPDCEDAPCLRALPRLRAALPERTDHA